MNVCTKSQALKIWAKICNPLESTKDLPNEGSASSTKDPPWKYGYALKHHRSFRYGCITNFHQTYEHGGRSQTNFAQHIPQSIHRPCNLAGHVPRNRPEYGDGDFDHEQILISRSSHMSAEARYAILIA